MFKQMAQSIVPYIEKVNFLMTITRSEILGTNVDSSDEMPKNIGLARYADRQASRYGNDVILYEFVVFEILGEWCAEHPNDEHVSREFIEANLGAVLMGTDKIAIHDVIHSHYGGWVLRGDISPAGMEELFVFLREFVSEFRNETLPVLSLSDDYDSDGDCRYE